MIQMSEGKKEKNFNNCPFKVTLPQITVMDGFIYLVFQIQSKPGIKVDISLNEVFFSDKLHRKYNEYYLDKCKQKDILNKNYALHIPIEKKNFLRADSKLNLTFLTSNQHKYEIDYAFRTNTGYELNYVMESRLDNEEQRRLEDSLYQSKQRENQVVKVDNTLLSESFKSREEKTTLTVQVPSIEKYKKALLREKYFLKNEGGRKYRLTNGRLINQKDDLCTYSFEMEAELNLTDDAPITLYVGSNVSTGNVLVCDGFEIIVIIDKNFGINIGQAMLGVEPWKLLEALVEKLDNIQPSSQLVMKLINEGPTLAINAPLSSIPKGQLAALNAEKNNDITVIWGPPGTGKTYTMAQIAKDELQNGKSILIVSHSNVSVDGVVKQTAAVLREIGLGNYLAEGKVLRYGYVRDEQLKNDSNAVAYSYALSRRSDLQRRMDQFCQLREKLKKNGEYNTYKGEQVESELKKLRAEIRIEERQYAARAKLVATTISKVTVDPLFEDKKYDIVMFDEASMAYVPQIFCAASYAKEKLVLVGDFRQLAPIVQSEAKSVLETDIFSYLHINDGMKVCAHPWLVMLNEQRRMHPLISAFSNKYIYNNLLLDHKSVWSNKDSIVQKEPFAGNAINLINLSGTYCAAMKNSDNSRFNIISAVISFSSALQAEIDGEKNVGIITPYAAQTRLIRAMIQDYRKNGITEISCSTVHQFQGSERNLIIFDAVESYPSAKVGWLMGKQMGSVSRLVNVAVTRARGKLIAVANSTFWENKLRGTDHIFYRLLQYLFTEGNVVSAKDKNLNRFIQQLPSTRNIINYNQIELAVDALITDIRKAQDKIVISIPDGKLDEETQGVLLKSILTAAAEGIRILCKTNGYADLPDKWKSIALASENAIFPLIAIDDKVIWYGLPKSRGIFKDGNTGYMTVCQTIYRIKGEHTIGLIKSFSDLENRVINGQRASLLEKNCKSGNWSGGDYAVNGQAEDDGNLPMGIDAFVRKMEKCPVCKSPMTVTRSHRGKVYLKCSSSSCKEMAYLTPDITNWYIDREQVTCPIHHCGIRAGVGKYGIYVRCEQGHFLKPDEI